jgi:hypothetical protein
MRAKFALAFCCLAVASAQAASVVFTVNATVHDNAAITGTMTIDTSAGTVTSVDLSVGAPDNLTFNSMAGSYQGSAGSAGYSVTVFSRSKGLQFTLLSDLSGTLVGYAGGAINTSAASASFLVSTSNPVVSGSLSSHVPVTISLAFAAATIPLNESVGLTFTVSNQTASSLAGINFTDTVDGGLKLSTPNGLNTNCPSGTVTAGPAPGNTGIISLAGLTLAASSSCTIAVSVTATMLASFTNSVTVGSSAGLGNTAKATFVSLAPPTLSELLSDTQLNSVASTTFTFTIGNPNPSDSLTGIAFTDNLLGGVLIAPGLTGDCPSDTISAPTGTNVVSVSGLTLSGGASCSFTIVAYGTANGKFPNMTSPVTSSNGGTGLPATAMFAITPPTANRGRYTFYLWNFF